MLPSAHLHASVPKERMKTTRFKFFLLPVLSVLGLFLSLAPSLSQDWFTTGINMGAPRIRLAVSDFPPRGVDQGLVSLDQEFNQVLWNDLDSAGIFEMVSRSYYPLKPPQEPADVVFNEWSGPPVEAQALAFGYAEGVNGNLLFTARLYDVKNPLNPNVISKKYVVATNELSVREAAHRFANQIVETLGGGIPGINLTKIAFASGRTGHPEIWVMDYDGFGQRAVTNYRSISLTPRWSPDNTDRK